MAEVKIVAPTGGDTAEHIAAMVAKADGLAAPVVAVTTERPAWLPQGFDTPEALAAAYAEATKKPVEAAVEATPAAADEAVVKAGLNMADLEAKVVAAGKLDDADYAALEVAGIPRAMADQYIAGQVALGEALTARIHTRAGGEEAFNDILQWAATGGITAAEADAFNSAVDSNNEVAVMMALDGLKAKYSEGGNATPALLGGGRGGGRGDVYQSIAQMTADMRNPDYARDPAFRAEVEAKVARSSIL